MMMLLASALLLTAAEPWRDPAEPEERRQVEAILDQLLAEDGNVYYFRDYRGHDHIGVGSRPRASDTHGLCRYDHLTIERDPKVPPQPDGAGGIREIKSTPWFMVLTDDRDTPLWDVSGEALERRCAALSTSEARWFIAETGYEAKTAVKALMALKEELLKPSPSPDVWGCQRLRRCPEPKPVAELIQPLDPGTVSDDTAFLPCPEDRWCLSVQLENPGCGAWVTQLRMDRGGDRFRSARVSWLAGMLECGEREMNEPPAEG